MAEQPDNASFNELPPRCSKIGSSLNEAFDLITQMAQSDREGSGKDKRMSIPTGFQNIDQHTHGLWPGELTVVTGDPGAGKTSFAANVAVNAAKLGARVLFVALGSNATETAIRMCASDGRIMARNLFEGRIDQDEWGALADAANRLSGLDMYICDNARMTPEGLRSIALKVVEGAERPLIVIDGTELIALPDERRLFDWPHALEGFSVFLKRLARESNAPIVATVKRAPYGKRIVRDYEEASSALPQDVAQMADSVLYISRHLADYDPDDIPSQTIAELFIAKHHMCAPVNVKLCFIPKYMCFMDYVDSSTERH